MPYMNENALCRGFERALIAMSGRQLLLVFWVTFLVAGACAAVPALQSSVVSIATQLALLLFWFGYPVVLFRCLLDGQHSGLGALVLVGAIILGYWLSMFLATDGVDPIRGVLVPVVGAVFVFSPFAAAAMVLVNVERRSQMDSKAGVVLTALALFGFPFFGGYVHERFRRVRLLL